MQGRPPVVIPARPGAPPAADLERYCGELDAVVDLSPASKSHYKLLLRRLTETTGRTVEWILANPKPAMRLLLEAKRTDGKRMMEVPMTIKAMIDALVALLKHAPGLKERYPDARGAWDALYKEVCARAEERYENNEASEKVQANFVPWPEILKRRDELIARASKAGPTSVLMMDAVVVAMHTMLPPARSDYGKLRVYRPPSDPVPSLESAVEPNRIVWTTSRKAGGAPTHAMHMVLDEFKTRRKKKKAHEADLPAELVALLVRSLEAFPRRYLIHASDAADGGTAPPGPYDNAGAYGQRLMRVFSALLGKHTTINSLRHAYSSNLDFNRLTPKERKEIAEAMMHSPEMTHRYRYVNVGGAASGDAAVGAPEPPASRKAAQAEAGKRWLEAGKRRSAFVSERAGMRALERALVK
jgi:hypothetical protein